jgi:hypothetical protein
MSHSALEPSISIVSNSVSMGIGNPNHLQFPATLVRDGKPGVHGTEKCVGPEANVEATTYIKISFCRANKRNMLSNAQRVTISTELTLQDGSVEDMMKMHLP